MTMNDESPSTHELSRVDVTRIHHYSRNPRRQLNPEYDRIKASIQAEGLDQPLVLSQEPGSSEYVLHSGGNTRLTILQELFEETGNERFRWIDCVIKPWSQESSVLFAHLRENELRGGLPFIDKALAVFEAKSLLEQELAEENLSQRQLEAIFRERGFGLSHSMISKMGYAVEILWPLMPKALAAGLGRPQVEKIRALERAAQAIWARHQLGDNTIFHSVFAELCRRHDGPEWDIQPLRDALENEIAVESEQHRQVIHLEMEAQMAGRPFDFSDNPAPEGESRPDSGLEAENSADKAQGTDKVISDDLPPESSSPVANNHGRDAEADTTTVASSVAKVNPVSNRTEVDALRIKLWDCASALAAAHGLREIVIQLPDQGLGFLLIGVPPQDLTETLDADMLALVSALWWQLAASSELTMAPVDSVLAYLDEASMLHQALASHDAGLLFNSVWTPDPGHLSSQLWQQLNPPEWQHLLQLMDAYRAIKRLAYDRGIELWVSGQGDGDVFQ